MANYGIYKRLGYNFDDSSLGIINLSQEAKDHLNSTPGLLVDWQKRDIADSNVSGYLKNPMNDLYISFRSNANSIFTVANNDPANTWSSFDAANLLISVSSSLVASLDRFKSHTDNISGVAAIESGGVAAGTHPYKKTATGIGKLLVYITNESDGILNASPILGSFTSLFVADSFYSNSNVIISDSATVNAAVNSGGGICILTLDQANVIAGHMNTANALIETRRNHDIQFFRNSMSVISDFGKTQEFANMGEVERNLANNYIGTDKLLSRINS